MFALTSDPATVVFPQLVRVTLSDSRLLLVFSGVAHVNLRRTSSGHWEHDTLVLILDTRPVATGGRSFVADQVAPLVTLNSIWDKDTAIKRGNAGFAVDWRKPYLNNPDFPFIFLECSIATRDNNAFLYRAGYHVTVTGKISSSSGAGDHLTRSDIETEFKKQREHSSNQP